MIEIKTTREYNFAARIVQRLTDCSSLIDAATNETISPFDLRRLITSFGSTLASVGLKARDRIAIDCTLSPASAIAYLGAMYAGLVPVLLDETTLKALGPVLSDFDIKALWIEGTSGFEWTSNSTIRVLHGTPALVSGEENQPAQCEEHDLAVLVATSGSTGVPRFVMVSHGNLIANTEAIIRSQYLAVDDRAMLILPVSYCFGASVLHSHLYKGGGVVFDRRFMFPDRVLRAIGQYGCTTFAGVPTVYNILLRHSNIRRIALSSLRRFLQAGGPLAPQSILELQDIVPTAKVFVMYGQTEATARISCLDPTDLGAKLGSVGRPLDNLTVRVVDEQGKDLPVGLTGEIAVSGPSVTLGYLNDPQATECVFNNGWLHTSDLGCIDDDGCIWIKGRNGEFLKMRGVRVSFAEVEARVKSLPGVYDCLATAVPHPEVGEALVLDIVLEAGMHDIGEAIRGSLPAHWTFDSIRTVSEIPKTSRGKPLRAARHHESIV